MFWLARKIWHGNLKGDLALEQVTEKISRQELDFGRESSKVAEIDTVLQSMDQMKEALKESLERQWNMEQMRREQVAALAHDIKTPLTILLGSAELTLEQINFQKQRICQGNLRGSKRLKTIFKYFRRCFSRKKNRQRGK